MYGGFGNDYLQADDDLDTDLGGSADIFADNRAPDGPQLSYEDRAHGGAGRDVLIANTGGDRLIDHVGEFNSYLVPYAPFGPATVSRAPQPALFEFMYDLAASDGADQTRAADAGNPDRNGEPDGEIGLVIQKDSDWNDQTGAPDDPQAGNIPGGPRDTLRGANFNQGNVERFAVDNGSFEAVEGRLQITPDSLEDDASAVFYVDAYMPNYFEIEATINAGKPTAGWKSNAYIIFDYYSPTDFKFAGVNISNDKIEMGSAVTLVVDNQDFFSHVFDPRTDADGFMYGINAGMVGLGSQNSIARIDNVAVKVLPPDWTLEDVEDFSDRSADLYTGAQIGTWQISGKGGNRSYVPALDTDYGYAASTTSLTLGSPYVLRAEATLATQGLAGIIFDQYSPTEFKFAGIDAETGDVVIGYHTAKSGWVYVTSQAKDIVAGRDYDLSVTAKGSTISVILNGQTVLSYSFNAVTVDGSFGVFARDANTSFDSISIATNDPAYLSVDDGNNLLATNGTQADMRLPLHMSQVTPVLDAAIAELAGNTGANLDYINVVIRDLPGDVVGRFENNTLFLDTDAAGYGWFVDPTPGDDAEFTLSANGLLASDETARGGIDLLSVIRHEIGHALDLEHSDEDGLMAGSVTPGIRLEPAAHGDGSQHVHDLDVIGAHDGLDILDARDLGRGGLSQNGVADDIDSRVGLDKLSLAAYLKQDRPEAIRLSTPPFAVHVDRSADRVETLYYDRATGGFGAEFDKRIDAFLDAMAEEGLEDDWIIRHDREEIRNVSEGGDRTASVSSKGSIDWSMTNEAGTGFLLLPSLLAGLRQVTKSLRDWRL
jgi:hypothetical protein